MVKTSFNFNPKSGPATLMAGGILFVLLGVFGKIGFLTFLGILMIFGGVGLSLYWADVIRRRG